MRMMKEKIWKKTWRMLMRNLMKKLWSRTCLTILKKLWMTCKLIDNKKHDQFYTKLYL